HRRTYCSGDGCSGVDHWIGGGRCLRPDSGGDGSLEPPVDQALAAEPAPEVSLADQEPLSRSSSGANSRYSSPTRMWLIPRRSRSIWNFSTRLFTLPMNTCGDSRMSCSESSTP